MCEVLPLGSSLSLVSHEIPQWWDLVSFLSCVVLGIWLALSNRNLNPTVLRNVFLYYFFGNFNLSIFFCPPFLTFLLVISSTSQNSLLIFIPFYPVPHLLSFCSIFGEISLIFLTVFLLNIYIFSYCIFHFQEFFLVLYSFF